MQIQKILHYYTFLFLEKIKLKPYAGNYIKTCTLQETTKNLHSSQTKVELSKTILPLAAATFRE